MEDWDEEIATGIIKTIPIADLSLGDYTHQSSGRDHQTNSYQSFNTRSRGGRDFRRGQEGRPAHSFKAYRQQENRIGDGSHVNQPIVIDVIHDSIRKVIGRGGSKIREIQETSGARIKVVKDQASLSSTPVEIFGTEEQKARAKQIIKDLTIPAGDIQAWADKCNRECAANAATRPSMTIDWDQLKQDTAEYERTRWAAYPQILKDFYREKQHIKCMSQYEVESIREKKNNITVMDLCTMKRPIPNPVLSFEDAFEDYGEIMDTIQQNKFVEPSPIQSQAWPVILSGKDCIGIAQTGTGKTLAFLLPAFVHIDQQTVPREKRGGPSCLVLSPTRELAQQIEMEVKKYHYKGIRSVCIYGGGDRRAQIQLVKKGVEIIIGTPGRLNDLLMNGFFSVNSVSFLILDEADRMLDMGFEPEIKKILIDIRPDRQTVMTSATWPPNVQRMADKYLHDPIRVNVGSLDLQACHNVSQLVEFIDDANKQERVMEFISGMEEDDKLIIFVGRKITADDISSNFAMRGLPVGIQCIHGDRDQSDREQALADIKSGRARVLIATDVASRGLDIKDITHVLNYDFPRHIEDYVHRIGRTGRAGRSGCALTFVTRGDWMHVGKLIPIMQEAGQDVPDELVKMAERWQHIRQQRDQERNSCGDRKGGCFNCGEDGHLSRDCPNRSRGRSNRGGGGGRRGKHGPAVSIGSWDAV